MYSRTYCYVLPHSTVVFLTQIVALLAQKLLRCHQVPPPIAFATTSLRPVQGSHLRVIQQTREGQYPPLSRTSFPNYRYSLCFAFLIGVVLEVS